MQIFYQFASSCFHRSYINSSVWRDFSFQRDLNSYTHVYCVLGTGLNYFVAVPSHFWPSSRVLQLSFILLSALLYLQLWASWPMLGHGHRVLGLLTRSLCLARLARAPIADLSSIPSDVRFGVLCTFENYDYLSPRQTSFFCFLEIQADIFLFLQNLDLSGAPLSHSDLKFYLINSSPICQQVDYAPVPQMLPVSVLHVWFLNGLTYPAQCGHALTFFKHHLVPLTRSNTASW